MENYRRAKLSLERGKTYVKDAPIRVCLVFPNTYSVGMSNLAVHTLYKILNSRSDCVCERSFCEEPLLGHSLETGSPLETFHIVAFSISFELDYPNVLRALRAARIPLTNADRDESYPFVIAGGPCIFSNPEPLADCIDLCAVGEGEELIGEILNVFSKTRMRGVTRVSTLRALSELGGAYVPSLHEPIYSDDGALMGMDSKNGGTLPISARVIANLDDFPCSSVIVTPEAEFSDMFLVELGRGCRRGCKFCSACYTYLRRNRSLESLTTQILAAEDLAKRVGLVTSDLADYPERRELLGFLLNKGAGFSVSSVRADAITEDLLAGMRAAGQRTLTLAPEVASEKLAALTGKRITSEALLKAVDMALEQGIVNFRLYFMIGFPGETHDDVKAIVNLVSHVHDRMQNAAKGLRKIGKLTISVNPFIPKPFTPLQHAPFADMAALSERINILRHGLARIGNTSLTVESPRLARLQCAFARGDRRAFRLAEMVAEGRTAADSMRSFGDTIERYLCAQPEDVGMRPWDIVQPPAYKKRNMRKD